MFLLKINQINQKDKKLPIKIIKNVIKNLQ
jgi:hypothetical protein